MADLLFQLLLLGAGFAIGWYARDRSSRQRRKGRRGRDSAKPADKTPGGA
jgi:lipopolysaccharide biosynthesis regulator YciM